MSLPQERWYQSLGACPDCRAPLELRAAAACECGFVIPATAPLDLRPRLPRERTLHVSIGASGAGDLAQVDVTRPEVTYRGPRAVRDSAELFSAAEPWLRPGAALLDYGCGPRDQAVPAQYSGLRYAGIDLTSAEADLLADAHAIPFRDSSFDAVLSYAVVEHLYNPFVAVGEVARVLRSGGVFFGAVSQGEPFHDSFFHHTAFGVLSVMRSAGLAVQRLWPSYDTLHALAVMGRYARVTRFLIDAVFRVDAATPFLAPRAFFRRTKREQAIERIHRAASLCFVATKP
jgi:SAM-dependent methyltransferase